jgi:hypothetical protein
MAAELQRRGWAVNHKRVLRLMHAEPLLVQVRRFCRTTLSQHAYGRYPNLIKHLVIERPDQVWCGEIVCTQLTKAHVLAVGAGRNRVTNLDIAVRYHNPVN